MRIYYIKKPGDIWQNVSVEIHDACKDKLDIQVMDLKECLNDQEFLNECYKIQQIERTHLHMNKKIYP